MSTPHIAAERGEIAERVLLPGDPLRAKHIAETFLTDARCYSNIRNVLGYTGLYKGKRISVQSTGMGIPSISIYTKELITEYSPLSPDFPHRTGSKMLPVFFYPRK